MSQIDGVGLDLRHDLGGIVLGARMPPDRTIVGLDVSDLHHFHVERRDDEDDRNDRGAYDRASAWAHERRGLGPLRWSSGRAAPLQSWGQPTSWSSKVIDGWLGLIASRTAIEPGHATIMSKRRVELRLGHEG